MILSVFYLLFKFKSLLPSPLPSKLSAALCLPAFPGEVCGQPGDTSLSVCFNHQFSSVQFSSVRRIIVSNNVDLGVILATLELLMVTTTVIIQPPTLALSAVYTNPRLSGWWQMPPSPLALTWLNCLQNITILLAAAMKTSRTAQCTFYTLKGHYGSSSPLSIRSAPLS